jgi:hypothetical protein
MTDVTYIVAPRYSGSTLLAFLMFQHPAVATVGERKKAYVKVFRPSSGDDVTCSCGRQFVECEFWTKLRDRTVERLDGSDLATNFTNFCMSSNAYVNHAATRAVARLEVRGMDPPPLLRPRWRRLREANRVLIEECLALQGGSHFLDSSKPVDQAIHLGRIPGINLRTILLLRDPRAQVFSNRKYNRVSLEGASDEWVDETSRAQALLSRWEIPGLTIRYEDLCRDPQATVQRCTEFMGLPPSQLDLGRFRDSDHHIMGNGAMRLGSVTTIEERTEWREALSAMEQKVIRERVGSRDFGYLS